MAIVAWTLLFTFGISGILTGITEGRYFLKRDYFQTHEFSSQMENFLDYLSVFKLNGMTLEEAKKTITVSKEEIKEHRYRYGDLSEQVTSIHNQYEPKIKDAQMAGKPEVIEALVAERDQKIEDITNNFKSDDYVKAKIVKEKEEILENYFSEIDKYSSTLDKYEEVFKYYLKDRATGKVYTNVNIGDNQNLNQIFNANKMLFIQNYPTENNEYLSIEGKYIQGSYDPNVTYRQLVPSLYKKERIFEGKIGVTRAVPATYPIVSDYFHYQKTQIIFYIYIIFSLIAFFVSLYLGKKTAVLSSVINESWRPYFNRIPIDVGIFLCGLTGVLSLIFMPGLSNQFLRLNWSNPYHLSENILIFCMTTLLVVLTLIQGKFLVDRLKKGWTSLKEEWKVSWGYKAYRELQAAFYNWKVGTQVLVLLGIVFLLGSGAILVFLAPPVGFLFYSVIGFFIGTPVLFFIIKRTGYFNRILENTNQLAEGKFEPDLPVVGKTALATLAANINTIKHGVKTSQKEQAKSERLKTELITNVSHDLRTPLTSIITYTELLKKPGLSSEERDAYIEIIDRKSKRLKVLIDDLFEVSKMASGNIELEKKKVDLVQLLQQALAEHNETIQKSSLQFRIKNPDTPIYAIVDGQKLWRVFDNLITNILKYSMENTRVYISINREENKAVIVFKNVTKYELSEEIDELFERFKRGDKSRHTEGSGLGLAIAKSIVDLHGGRMDIEVDGDLFKVIVTLDALE